MRCRAFSSRNSVSVASQVIWVYSLGEWEPHMKTVEPRAIHLKDDAPPPYRIPEIALDFRLDGKATLVASTMKVERRAASAEPLVLEGNDLKLVSIALDGKPLDSSAYAVDTDTLTVHAPPASFTL